MKQEKNPMRKTQFATIPNPNALKEVWQYYVQENHLSTGCRELAKFLGLLFVSGGSVLYGSIAKKATEEDPIWEQDSFILGTSLCAGIVLINSTNEYFLKRDARRLPLPLRALSQGASQCKYLLEDMAIGFVSALSSLSLATTAWKYPDWPNVPLQVVWLLYIETVNTILHLWPVDVFMFGHPLYSLPLRPFQWIYHRIESSLISVEEQETRKFIQFKRTVADDLCAKMAARLDKAATQIIHDSFEWNGFSQGIRKWFTYVKKRPAPVDTVLSKEFSDVIVSQSSTSDVEQKSNYPWRQWLGKKLQQVSYALGATLVTSSCMGYLVDPPYTLQEFGLSEKTAIIITSSALYFLGVLLAHTGGVSMQADVARAGRILQCQEPMPLPAKLHTKSFGLAVLLNLYIAGFSYGGSVQTVRDHFKDSRLESFFLWCAQYGLIYLSLSSVGTFYQYYLTQFVRLYQCDENHLVAQFEQKKEAFKRHLPAIDPDHLVASLMTYSDQQLQHIIGMSKSQLEELTDFEARFEEYQQNQKTGCPQLGIGLSHFFRRKRDFDERLITRPINDSSGSLRYDQV